MPQAAANLTNFLQMWTKIGLIRKIKIQLIEFKFISSDRNFVSLVKFGDK